MDRYYFFPYTLMFITFDKVVRSTIIFFNGGELSRPFSIQTYIYINIIMVIFLVRNIYICIGWYNSTWKEKSRIISISGYEFFIDKIGKNCNFCYINWCMFVLYLILFVYESNNNFILSVATIKSHDFNKNFENVFILCEYWPLIEVELMFVFFFIVFEIQ